MPLKTVTITGADDSTPIIDLLSLSREYPFVEWGILVSARSEGSYRFPSRNWINELVCEVNHLVRSANPIKLSMHICGRWVRQMFVGELDWLTLPSIVEVSQRIQINTHAERHTLTTGMIQSLDEGKSISIHDAPQFIFQWDGVNNLFVYAAKAYGLNVAALFDTSGGAGQLPDAWPEPAKEFPCGYAGGLGPDNVEAQLRIIEQRCADRDFWIDMESRVRTEDDSRLDLDKVRAVLEICQPYVIEKSKQATATSQKAS
jgi:hypothetical protein